MSGRRSLWVYVLTLLSLLVLLFFYGAPILLAAIVVLLLLPLPLGLGLRRDAKLIQLECQYPAKVQVGQKTELRFLLHRKRMLFSGRCAYVTILVHNTMTGQDTLHDLCMPIWGDGEAYVLEEPLQECGELVVSFQKGWIVDHLELFRCALGPFDAMRSTVYPQLVSVDATLEQRPVGSPWEDGPMQNRKGADHSETFDIREYHPGDDVRSIHWKLSVKADNLIVRIPGSPEFFDLVVLPNFGLEDDSGPVPQKKRNAALAYGCAVLDRLTRKGIRCCLALPRGEELVLRQITGPQELEKVMVEWMGTPLPKVSGQPMRMFRSQHLDLSFSRMLLLNTDREMDRRPLNGMAVTVLAVTENGSQGMTELGEARLLELPEKPERSRTYRIQV